jgi:hypothetical protein
MFIVISFGILKKYRGSNFNKLNILNFLSEKKEKIMDNYK